MNIRTFMMTLLTFVAVAPLFGAIMILFPLVLNGFRRIWRVVLLLQGTPPNEQEARLLFPDDGFSDGPMYLVRTVVVFPNS